MFNLNFYSIYSNNDLVREYGFYEVSSSISLGRSTAMFEDLMMRNLHYSLTKGDIYLVHMIGNTYNTGIALIIYDILLSSALGSYAISSSTNLFKSHYSNGSLHVALCAANGATQSARI